MTRAAVALTLLAVTTAAPAAADRTAQLRKAAGPTWSAYTREHVARTAGTTPRYIRTRFAHQSREVRYSVAGTDGRVSAAGTAQATAPQATEAEAKAAPWTVSRRARLTIHYRWRDGRWTPGPVEWGKP